MKKRHINVPVFIPHLGCPNNCTFCNQKTISGVKKFEAESVIPIIEEALSTVNESDTAEIAYFGGSFTGIDRNLMESLLSISKKYLDEGRITSVRCSTRPDYINDEIIADLSRFSVRTVELGLQSFSDEVLRRSGRGHDAECARVACRKLKASGFTLIGQMMIGLPGSDTESEILTAREIISAGADGARVYPTVVFYDTELSCMTERGEYVPLSNEDAVMRTKAVLDVFDRARVPCIRVGLQASENLSDESCVMAGANHSAIGELAMGELYYERICAEIEKSGARGGEICVLVPMGAVSKAVGQKKKNKQRLIQKYGFRKIKFVECPDVEGYNVKLQYKEKANAEEEKTCI